MNIKNLKFSVLFIVAPIAHLNCMKTNNFELPKDICDTIVNIALQSNDIHEIKSFGNGFLKTCKKFTQYNKKIKNRLLEVETFWINKIDRELAKLDTNLTFSTKIIAKNLDAKVWAEKNKVNFNNITDNINTNILARLAHQGNDELIDLLVSANSAIRNTYPYGGQALETAHYENHTDAVTALIENNLNESLLSASGAGLKRIVKFLLTLNTDVNYKDKYGMTPLMAACANQREEIIKMLLQHKADVNMVDQGNRTALDFAQLPYYRYQKTKDILISAGAVSGQDIK